MAREDSVTALTNVYVPLAGHALNAQRLIAECEALTVPNSGRRQAMDHEQARTFFNDALRHISGRRDSWWPTQPETAALGWSIAFSWTKHDIAGLQLDYWTTWGQKRHWGLKRRVRKAHGVRLSAIRDGQYMVDFAVLPAKPEKRCHREPLLTMESEAYARHFVSVGEEGDYAWDFLKLLWVRSPRRVFIARVGTYGEHSTHERITTLRATLDEFVSHNRHCFIKGDEMIVFVLGANARSRDDSMVGMLVEHEQLRWEKLDSVVGSDPSGQAGCCNT
jgi:hypothetical protein